MNDKKQFIKDMTDFKALHDKSEENVRALSYVGFDIANAPFILILDEFEVTIIYHISERYGIEQEALCWFIYENNWGANGYECRHKDGKPKKLKTFSDFWNFEKGAK